MLEGPTVINVVLAVVIVGLALVQIARGVWPDSLGALVKRSDAQYQHRDGAHWHSESGSDDCWPM
jgi:hypothetical protein